MSVNAILLFMNTTVECTIRFSTGLVEMRFKLQTSIPPGLNNIRVYNTYPRVVEYRNKQAYEYTYHIESTHTLTCRCSENKTC